MNLVTRSRRNRIFGLVGLITLLLVAIIGFWLLRWTSSLDDKYLYLQEIYKEISHPSETQYLLTDKCSGLGGNASSDKNALLYYCSLLASNENSSNITQYYEREFTQHSWNKVEDNVYRVDNDTQIEYLEIKPNTPIPMNIDVSQNILSTAWQKQQVIYLIVLYTHSEG